MRRCTLALTLAVAAACSVPKPDSAERMVTEEITLESVGDAAAPAGADASAATKFGIPVLLFHSICVAPCAADDIYGMDRATFDSLLSSFDSLGYRAISSAEFSAYRTSKTVALPPHPIYLTFDDGRADAYANATPVLARHHARATMFIITDRPTNAEPGFMSWKDISDGVAAGVWDIELHANAGHSFVTTGASTEGHFFAWRAWNAGQLESFQDWKTRTENDIAEGERLLAQHLPGRVPHSFALPFGDYGQFTSNDPNIQVAMRSYLNQHYPAWFTQPVRNAPFALPSAGGETWRYTIEQTTTVATVLAWLAGHSH